MMNTNKQQTFETETCSRCGGCGRYSYCQMYGDTCFKCHGKGKVYTKRGLLAKLKFESLASLPLESLEVGMSIWDDNLFGKSGWSVVESIAPDKLNPGMITVTTKKLSLGTYAGHIFRVRQTPEQVAAKMSVALAYERSLTKSGKIDTKLAKFTSTVAWG